jgi:hypothetical protein
MKYLQSTYTLELTRNELSTLYGALRTHIEAFKPEDFVGSDPSGDPKRLQSFIGALLTGDEVCFPFDQSEDDFLAEGRR